MDERTGLAEEAPATPVPSATVMLVRDGAPGVEVFLMKRSGFGAFGGLHVFPGGKVDGADRTDRWAGRASGPNDAEASAVLGVERGGLAYWIACIRECFEEAGILLAKDASGRTLRFSLEARRKLFSGWRDRLNAGEADVLEAMCRAETLTLETDQLAYVSHWITPVDQAKRFNTRFFVARAPAEQEALHDGHEAVESEWIRPEVALDRFRAGTLPIISPTEKNLEAISGYPSTEALLDEKRSIDPQSIPTILPRLRARGEKGYEEAFEVVGYGGRAANSAPSGPGEGGRLLPDRAKEG